MNANGKFGTQQIH